VAAAFAVSGSAGHAHRATPLADDPATGTGWHAHESASRSSGSASKRAVVESPAFSLREKSAKGATASAAAAQRRNKDAGAHAPFVEYSALSAPERLTVELLLECPPFRRGDPGNELAFESAVVLPYELEPLTTFAFAFLLVVVALVSAAGPLFLEGENIESDASRDAALVADASFSAFSEAASAACSASVSATAAIKPDGSSAHASASRTAATSKDRDVGSSSRVPVREPFAEKKTNALATASHANARVISQSARSSPRGKRKALACFCFPGFAKATAKAKAARAEADTSFTGKPSSNASASATSAAATRAPSRAEAWSAVTQSDRSAFAEQSD